MTIRHIGHSYQDADDGTLLDVWFPIGELPPRRHCLAEKRGLIRGEPLEVVIASLDDAPRSPADAWLRLHLLSRREVKPNALNLEGLFSLLSNVAWTSAGPVLPHRVDLLRSLVAEDWHHLITFAVDKFPRMVDYVVPDAVRIGDADRVRLGAHLAAGTTVMHEGFVNFNAGTLGESMVEGRVTPGVVIGKNSDVGAGASIMGTLSGGGRIRNSIGERSLLGANAGIGIALGDDCIVEAGLYVTAGTKVRMPNGEVVAARSLSGRHGLLFRRNSQTGVVEAIENAGRWAGLNASLHQN